MDWHHLHRMAAEYPVKPTREDKDRELRRLYAFSYLISCKKCSNNFRKKLRAYPPRLDSRDDYLIWTCFIHNQVNKANGKKEYPCDLALLKKIYGKCDCEDEQKQE